MIKFQSSKNLKYILNFTKLKLKRNEKLRKFNFRFDEV